MWRWDEDWFVEAGPPIDFPPEWRPTRLRYRHPKHWHWARIYSTTFWIALPIILIFVRWP